MSQQMNQFLKLLESSRAIVADGAMATSLYEKGFYINRSFEELNVVEAQAVRDTHKGFLQSGSDIIHTNSFSANTPKLTQYGLQTKLAEILQQSAKVAREAAGNDKTVLGLIGPLSVLIEPLGPTSVEEAETYYKEIVDAFESTDIDGFALYALHDLNEMRAAIKAIRTISKKPIAVCMGVQDNLKSSQGHSLQEFVTLTDEFSVEAIGLCGEVGPSQMLTAIEKLRPLTEKPLIALPNAGMPRYVNDQYIYLCSPDYMGKYARRLIQAGANIVGGHCGVYESHIKSISNAAKMMGDASADTKKAKSKGIHLPQAILPIQDKPEEITPLEKRSQLGADLASGKEIISVELVPPSLGTFEKFLSKCKELEDAKVKYVNIPDGARAMARVSAFQLSSYVKQKFNLEPIPHMTCRDRNLIGLQSDLLGAEISDVKNILVVTGDPPKLGNNPDASAVYDVDSIGLTHILARMNKGLDRGGASAPNKTSFVVGVALNPTAANMDLELKRYRYKVEAGADFAVTQPIYDLERYKMFMDEVAKFPRQIPIIMGIWPLVSLRNAEFLKNEVPGIEVPDNIIERMATAEDDKEKALSIGLEIAHKTVFQARKEKLISGFQISAPFNRVEVALQALDI